MGREPGHSRGQTRRDPEGLSPGAPGAAERKRKAGTSRFRPSPHLSLHSTAAQPELNELAVDGNAASFYYRAIENAHNVVYFGNFVFDGELTEWNGPRPAPNRTPIPPILSQVFEMTINKAVGLVVKAFGAPLWMVALWMNFGLMLSPLFTWFMNNLIRTLLGFSIGGAIAYYSGEKLGVLTMEKGWQSILAIGFEWALAGLILHFLWLKLAQGKEL